MNSVNQMVNDLKSRMNAEDTTSLVIKNKQKGKVKFPWPIFIIVVLSIGVGALITLNYTSMFDSQMSAPVNRQNEGLVFSKEMLIDVVPQDKKINLNEMEIASLVSPAAEKKIVQNNVKIDQKKDNNERSIKKTPVISKSETIDKVKHEKKQIEKKVTKVNKVKALKPEEKDEIKIVDSIKINDNKTDVKEKSIQNKVVAKVNPPVNKETEVVFTRPTGKVKVAKVENKSSAVEFEEKIKIPSNDAFNKTQIPFSNIELAETMYQRGATLLNQGEFDRASLLFEKALKEYPAFLKATEALVSIYTNNGDWASAEKVLKSGINAERKNTSLTMLLAQIYLQLEREPEALSLLKNNIIYAKGNGEYFALLAVIYQSKEEYVLALDYYQKALKIDNTSSRWWFGMAVILELQNNMTDAKVAYTQALQTSQLTDDLVAYAEQRLEYVSSQIEISSVR